MDTGERLAISSVLGVEVRLGPGMAASSLSIVGVAGVGLAECKGDGTASGGTACVAVLGFIARPASFFVPF